MIINENLSNAKGNIVYTAIFGSIKDKLHKRPWQYSNASFYSFLDAERLREKKYFNLTKWRLHEARFKNDNLRRQARAHKVLAHKIFPDCRYSLWIDGCFKLIIRDVNGIMEKHLKNADLCVFKHRKRNCIYEELNACIEQQKDDKERMIDQVSKYREEGYPVNNGLDETTALLRRHNKATNEFNEMWWEEISNGSLRDQLSFDYIAWKLGMKYEIFPGNMSSNPYFKWFRH